MSKYICDGHEYTVTNESRPNEDIFEIKNNYGTHVASLHRPYYSEYWRVQIVDNPDQAAKWHENDVIDNLLEQNAVQAYVAWAIDNDTVENH